MTDERVAYAVSKGSYSDDERDLAQALFRTLYDAGVSFQSGDLIPRLTATVRAAGWRRQGPIADEGPARIVQMPPSPETSARYWESHCPVCATYEGMYRYANDERLIALRDEHNARHRETPLPGPITDEAMEAAAYRYWLESTRDAEGDYPDFDWEPDEREQFMWAARVVLEAAERVRSAVPSTTEPSDQWVTAPDGEEFRVGACQGHSACPVDRHEHGCFADDGINCDHPEDHEPTEQEQR